MASVGKTLDLARSKLGVGERPANSNCQPFSKYWKHGCEPWCADFASYVLKETDALDVPFSAAARYLAQGFKNAGRWHSKGQAGDLIFFTWPGDSEIHHVGIVEKANDDGSYTTIEGNTDNKVMRRVRRSSITGFGRPEYSKSPTPSKPKPEHTDETPERPHGTGPVAHAHLTVDGKRGPLTVKALQRALNARLGTDLDIDGKEGPKTVKAEQRYLRVAVDGKRGPETIKAEQRRTGARVDGKDGDNTTRMLQRALNEARF